MTSTSIASQWAPLGTEIRTPSAFDSGRLINRQKTQSTTLFPFVKPSSRLIQQLRKKSGLNWTELALMVDVDRRTLNNWANGKEVSRDNLDHLQKLAKSLLDNSSRFSSDNRDALLSSYEQGGRIIDLFKTRLYDQAGEALSAALAAGSVNERSDNAGFKPNHVESRPLRERLTADHTVENFDSDLPVSEGEWLSWDD